MRSFPVGVQNPDPLVMSGPLPSVVLFLLFLTVRALAQLLRGRGADVGTKDLEILVLRHQLRVLRRKRGPPKLRATDRALLAAVSRVLPRERWASFIVAPQTLLRWHRELVRRKWTYGSARRPGRPPLDAEVRDLILRLARENPRWGCVRISGEMRQLGIRVGATTVRMLVRRTGLGPAPRRLGPTWAEFLLLRGRRHLDHVLRTYAAHYNRRRPHRSLALAAPLTEASDLVLRTRSDVRRRDVLGGLIHEYYGVAA